MATQPAIAAASQATNGDQTVPVDRYFSELLVGMQKSTLESGLRVVLHPDRTVPFIAISSSFASGSSSQVEGWPLPPRLADYLRHRRLAPAYASDHALLRARGARLETHFGWHHTSFNEVLPSSELDFALWLEARRLRALTAAERRATRLLPLPQQAESLLQPQRHAHHSLRRFMAGAATADLPKDLWKHLNREFFSPKRAVLTLVGDFEPEVARRLIARHLGSIADSRSIEKLSPLAAKHERNELPSEALPRDSSTTQGPSASTAGPPHQQPTVATEALGFRGIVVGFHTPTAADEERWALEVAAQLLESPNDPPAQSAFLTAAGATQVTTHLSDGSTTGAFTIVLSLEPGARKEHARATLFQRLTRLGNRPPKPRDFEQAKRAVLIAWLKQFTSIERRAALLGRFESLHGDARLATRRHLRLLELQAPDVSRVVKATLSANQAFVLNATTHVGGTP